MLARAEQNRVAVNLLISPHYFPAWALAKWPELNVANNGFIKFSLFLPRALAIMEDYLRTLIPAVRTYSSLHSITLSNESVYQSNKDAYALPAWHDYLGQIYNCDIGRLNSVVEYGGHTLLNVVNYGPTAVTAAIRSGDKQAAGFTNLITGETKQAETVELQPLTPYLFTIDTWE